MGRTGVLALLLLCGEPVWAQAVAPAERELPPASVGTEEVVADSWRPALLERSEPAYPVSALQRGLEGECDVRLRIDQAGQARVEQMTCSAPEFEAPTRAALARWRFTPWPGPEPLSENLYRQLIRYRL